VGKDEKERLTLYSLPVTRLDAQEEIVKKFIENSPKPSLLLMDRDFTIEVIKLLDKMSIKFIIPAVMNERVKIVVDDYIHVGHILHSWLHSVQLMDHSKS